MPFNSSERWNSQMQRSTLSHYLCILFACSHETVSGLDILLKIFIAPFRLPHLAYMSIRALSMHVSVSMLALHVRPWICWPYSSKQRPPHAVITLERVKWLGTKPSLRICEKMARAFPHSEYWQYAVTMVVQDTMSFPCILLNTFSTASSESHLAYASARALVALICIASNPHFKAIPWVSLNDFRHFKAAIELNTQQNVYKSDWILFWHILVNSCKASVRTSLWITRYHCIPRCVN